MPMPKCAHSPPPEMARIAIHLYPYLADWQLLAGLQCREVTQERQKSKTPAGQRLLSPGQGWTSLRAAVLPHPLPVL